MIRKKLLRSLYVSHRWVGIALCPLMLGWCVSGLIMLWHTWPQPDDYGQANAHAVLALPAQLPPLPPLAGNTRFQAFRISMVGHTPMLTLSPDWGSPYAINLTTGAVGPASVEDLADNARRYVVATGGSGVPVFTGVTTDDQWVLDTHGRMEGFARFEFANRAKTVVYVSQTTGDVVQATTAASRLWAWVGAIPHWLYPAILRRHPAVWKEVVILFSGVGVFLTLTGLWVGVLRLKRKWPYTPYTRWHFVHHLGGMVFGLFALSWITTGLLTMNPAGLFESQSATALARRVTGTVSGADIQNVLYSLTQRGTHDGKSVYSALLNGEIYNVIEDTHGHITRQTEAMQPAPLTQPVLAATLKQAGIITDTRAVVFLTTPDHYYFSKETRKRQFPVWCVNALDGTFFYLEARSGQVIAAIDPAAQNARWFVYGLHDGDFWPWLRAPSGRWLVVVPLLAGVLVIFLSGCIVGFRRMKQTMR